MRQRVEWSDGRERGVHGAQTRRRMRLGGLEMQRGNSARCSTCRFFFAAKSARFASHPHPQSTRRPHSSALLRSMASYLLAAA